MIKSKSVNRCNTIGYRYRCQARATGKSISADNFNFIEYGIICHSTFRRKRFQGIFYNKTTSIVHCIFSLEFLQTAAIPKSPVTNSGNTLGYHYRRQALATPKSTIADSGNALGYRYLRQALAIFKSIAANSGNTLTYRYRRQAHATIKSISADSGNTIGYRYRRQARAIVKSLVANNFNFVRYGILSQSARCKRFQGIIYNKTAMIVRCQWTTKFFQTFTTKKNFVADNGNAVTYRYRR